jgi:voltage-gated potassium channel Kch
MQKILRILLPVGIFVSVFIVAGVTGWWHTASELDRANQMRLEGGRVITDPEIRSRTLSSFWIEGAICGSIATGFYLITTNIIKKRRSKS